MVHSVELGYDPEEWEECDDDQYNIFIGFYSKMFLSLIVLFATAGTFWLIEARKEWAKGTSQIEDTENEPREAEMESLDEADLMRKLRQVTRDEVRELEEWQQDMAELEQSRLLELEQNYCNTDSLHGLEYIEGESQLIESLLPMNSSQSLDFYTTNVGQSHQRNRDGFGDWEQLPSSLAAEREMDVNYNQECVLIDKSSQPTFATKDLTGSENRFITVEANSRASNQDDRIIFDSQNQNQHDSDQQYVQHQQHCKDGHLRNASDLQSQVVHDEQHLYDQYQDGTTNQQQQSSQSFLYEKQVPEIEVGIGSSIVAPSGYEDKLASSNLRFEQVTSPQMPSKQAELRQWHASSHESDNIRQGRLPNLNRGERDSEELVKISKSSDRPLDMGSYTQYAPESIQEYVKYSENTGKRFDGPKWDPEKSKKLAATPSDDPCFSCLSSDEKKCFAEADIYIHDAIEYMAHERVGIDPAFVIEEDMLESTGNNGTPQQGHLQVASAAATSQLVKTAEVFERIDTDIDDAMTYAPEIQSIEIPPDQSSDISENLLEYFDQAALESSLAEKVPKFLQGRPSFTNVRPKMYDDSPSMSSVRSTKSGFDSSYAPSEVLRKQSSLLSVLGVTSMQEMLLAVTSLDSLSNAMRKAGLESTNVIFGIDYTASNKYQGENSFSGHSLHAIDADIPNPYQQVMTVMGRTLAPFASSGFIHAYGFGDARTSDWSVFKLKSEGECSDLDEVLRTYNEVTPSVNLSGPTNFAPLIYQAIEICEKVQDYHILVIIADGQVTNEKATKRAILRACKYPLSIIVVGVGDGPWDMMKVFDDSLPKRSWDNFHFVQFHQVMQKAVNAKNGELSFAIQSLLEIPDQYNMVRKLGLIRRGSCSTAPSKV